MAIEALDFDGIRLDKAAQMTIDYSAEWVMAMRQCARNLGKRNFIINGEVRSAASADAADAIGR